MLQGFLIDALFSHGFSSSYSEVKKYERSAAVSQDTDIPGVTKDHFLQYVADNVDHDICTLDCFDTFHGMGMIAALTPAAKRHKAIPRRNVRLEEIKKVGKIQFHFYMDKQVHVNELLRYERLDDFSNTTSRLFGIGKAMALKRIKDDTIFQQQATVFFDSKSSVDDVVLPGERAVVSLYSGRTDDSLDILRYKRFCEKVSASATFVQVHMLPPTSDAVKYHSVRVYLQVQQWIDVDCRLDPQKWGWHFLQDSLLHPYQTELPPAPETLLQSIRCNCKTDCDSKRCICRKNGLSCSPACGDCRGVSCANSPSPSLSDLTESMGDVSDSD